MGADHARETGNIPTAAQIIAIAAVAAPARIAANGPLIWFTSNSLRQKSGSLRRSSLHAMRIS
jgi:hypothetical protein